MTAESIDLVRIQNAIAAGRRAEAARGPVQTAVRVAVRYAAILTTIVFFLPALSHWDKSRLTGLTAASFSIRVVGILFVTLVLTVLDTRKRQRVNAEDAAVAAARIAREWTSLTHSDWLLRVLRWGAAITAGVGIPVGLLLAITTPATELPSGGRFALFVEFLVLTSAWAIPAAFWIRWMVLKSYRRMNDERTA